MGSSLSNDADIVLNMNEVQGWSKEDVAKWLDEIGFSMYKKKFLQNEIDGEALLLLNEERLERLGVTLGPASKILQRVHVLKEPVEYDVAKPTTSETIDTPKPLQKQSSGKKPNSPQTSFTQPMSVTPSKPLSKQEEEKLIQLGIKKLEKLKGLQNLSFDQRKDKARNLVVKEALLASYLNSDYVATRKTMCNLLETNESAQNNNFVSIAQSTASQVVDGNQIMDDEEDKEHIRSIMQQIDVIESGKNVGAKKGKITQQELQMQRNSPVADSMSELSQIVQKSQLTITNEEFLKVKLVIVEIHNSASQRTFRRVLSPLMDTFNISPQFGLFHSALIVGPWYLEWNDSCLVVPRKCYSGAAVLAADVEKFFKGPQVSVALDRISNVICEWNANYQYSQQKYNCQLFVDELCKALDITLNFNGALGSFLQQLRKTGQCELGYQLSPDLQKSLGITESYKKFKTHKELDEFVTMVRDKLPTYFDMDPVGRDDWVLLKSYDRAFWLRHFKNKKAEEYAPLVPCCPFSNPTVSGSIIDNFFTYKNKKK